MEINLCGVRWGEKCECYSRCGCSSWLSKSPCWYCPGIWYAVAEDERLIAESNGNPQLWHMVQEQETCEIKWCCWSWTICCFAQENTVHVFSVVRVPEHSRRRSGVGGGRCEKYCQMSLPLSLCDLLSTGRHLLGVSFIATLKSN